MVATDLSVILTSIKKPKFAVIAGLISQPFWFLSLSYDLHYLFANQMLISLNWIIWVYNSQYKIRI